ncbi:MAG: hypothetical protein ABI760_16770, partial [Ferruginibacter sp.]
KASEVCSIAVAIIVLNLSWHAAVGCFHQQPIHHYAKLRSLVKTPNNGSMNSWIVKIERVKDRQWQSIRSLFLSSCHYRANTYPGTPLLGVFTNSHYIILRSFGRW